ncbi:MAG: hypothetical protein ACPL7D_01860 [Candidatus Sumerlaeaceae bacterium]|jgi:hypothetical protein
MSEKPENSKNSPQVASSSEAKGPECCVDTEQAMPQQATSGPAATQPQSSPKSTPAAAPKPPTSNKTPAPTPPPVETRPGFVPLDPELPIPRLRPARVALALGLFIGFAVAFAVGGEWFIRSILLPSTLPAIQAVGPSAAPSWGRR